MKILITSGGTSEQIDDVRKITNTATGRLGAIIAEGFTRAGADVCYVCTQGAHIPANVQVIRISSAVNLLHTMEHLLTENTFDAVIHSMAVSDYAVSGTASVAELARIAAEKLSQTQPQNSNETAKIIQQTMLNSLNKPCGKLSSNIEDLAVFMHKTPKVIGVIKKLQPNTMLFGFKLLSEVGNAELLEAGHNLLVKNNCDYVLANDSSRIFGDNHEAILISPNREIKQLYTKQEIAKAIIEKIMAFK